MDYFAHFRHCNSINCLIAILKKHSVRTAKKALSLSQHCLLFLKVFAISAENADIFFSYNSNYYYVIENSKNRR
jgi:hypothetical protein